MIGGRALITSIAFVQVFLLNRLYEGYASPVGNAV